MGNIFQWLEPEYKLLPGYDKVQFLRTVRNPNLFISRNEEKQCVGDDRRNSCDGRASRASLVGKSIKYQAVLDNSVRSSDQILTVTIESVVLGDVFLISLLANVCMIVLIIKGKRLANFQCFVLNLFLADIVFVGVIPFIFTVRWTESWTLGPYVCHILFYVMATSAGVTIITLAAISVERSISILNLRLKSSLHLKSEYQICTLVWPNMVQEIIWDVFYSLVDFVVPGLIIVISYTKILKITKAARRRLQANRPCPAYQQQIRVSKQDYWLFRTLLVLMISFFIMWTPIVLIIFLILAQNFKRDLLLSSTWFFWVCTFTFTNSAVNPILYGASQFKAKWPHVLHFFHLPHFINHRSLATGHALRKVRTQDQQTPPSIICD
ncbi:LOW QUALITY PROTEIN: free fatty acid receptor 4-like [Pristis pectinata]|uniref:LOW QUALITY PROTEIN: free fatty acid receptor 4-like n=1 Tax=Pristis pectinata TaxID=685728 RepID=UPI00223E735B|nr:LOW QUALITY PROTEIN: free fatty acid receptor 4-like [Pristis pectinata]